VFTIRHVEVLPDFSQARIWISRIGGDIDFFKRLEKAKNRISKEVYNHIKMVKSPILVFYEDFTGESAERIEKIIRSEN
jgi:ribosome-binding factor A